MMGRGIRVARRRAMVGTAVGVAATASMVSNARRNRAERQAIEQQTNTQPDPQENTAYTQAPAECDVSAQLKELNELKNQGILTQSEFEAKKKQILGI